MHGRLVVPGMLSTANPAAFERQGLGFGKIQTTGNTPDHVLRMAPASGLAQAGIAAAAKLADAKIEQPSGQTPEEQSHHTQTLPNTTSKTKRLPMYAKRSIRKPTKSQRCATRPRQPKA
jgi:hypothetical protein